MPLRDALSCAPGMTHADECEKFKVKTGSLPARNDKLEKPPGFRQCDELCSIRAVFKKPVIFGIAMIETQPSGAACDCNIIPQRVRRYFTPKLMNAISENFYFSSTSGTSFQTRCLLAGTGLSNLTSA